MVKLPRLARRCVSQVKYREDGAVDQFLSDVSVLGPRGIELTRKSISVNDPLRFRVRLACQQALCALFTSERRCTLHARQHRHAQWASASPQLRYGLGIGLAGFTGCGRVCEQVPVPCRV